MGRERAGGLLKGMDCVGVWVCGFGYNFIYFYFIFIYYYYYYYFFYCSKFE